jgi:hypothetical protein
MRNDMTALSALRYDKNTLRKWFHKWFGANRGTHWTIAGSVAVIIFGSYLVYNSRNSNTTIIIPAVEQTPSPMTPGPFPLKRWSRVQMSEDPFVIRMLRLSMAISCRCFVTDEPSGFHAGSKSAARTTYRVWTPSRLNTPISAGGAASDAGYSEDDFRNGGGGRNEYREATSSD